MPKFSPALGSFGKSYPKPSSNFWLSVKRHHKAVNGGVLLVKICSQNLNCYLNLSKEICLYFNKYSSQNVKRATLIYTWHNPSNWCNGDLPSNAFTKNPSILLVQTGLNLPKVANFKIRNLRDSTCTNSDDCQMWALSYTHFGSTSYMWTVTIPIRVLRDAGCKTC